jgi:hypothetical protein
MEARMNRIILTVTIAGGGWLLSGLAVAQEPAPSRVRLTLDPEIRVPDLAHQRSWITGTLVGMDEDRLTVRLDGQKEAIGVPTRAVKYLEVSRGPRSLGAGALRGALLGAGVAAMMSVVVVAVGYSWERATSSQVAYAESGGMGGMAAQIVFKGAAAGAVLGMAFPGERWEKTAPTPRLAVGIRPVRGGAAFSVSAAF